VIHLVTLSVVDERPGRGAAVLLTAAGDDDGLLQPAEIARLRLDARLTVLAACRTALAPAGDAGGGGALTSLTGAFLAAGSEAVVATLWDVGDAATAVFMDQLYARLGRGVPPARALAETKRALRADPRWNRPSLWSGYVLVGRAGGPVAVGRPAGWRWAAALALAVALALVAGWLTRTRSSRRTA
jgi:CHAT domain-containing protein